jgi:hypothetical protein
MPAESSSLGADAPPPYQTLVPSLAFEDEGLEAALAVYGGQLLRGLGRELAHFLDDAERLF